MPSSRHSRPAVCNGGVQCRFTSTEILRTTRDGAPRTAISTFTQLLSSEWCRRVRGRIASYSISTSRPLYREGHGHSSPTLPSRQPHRVTSGRANTVLNHTFYNNITVNKGHQIADSLVGRASDRKGRRYTDTGSSPWCGKGFFSQSQLSVPNTSCYIQNG